MAKMVAVAILAVALVFTGAPGTAAASEIKVGTIMADAFNSNSWVVYVVKESVKIQSRNPFQFSCKSRMVAWEDDDDGVFPSANRGVIGQRKYYTHYEFYVKDDEVYYNSRDERFGIERTGMKMAKDRVASMIYRYVFNNM